MLDETVFRGSRLMVVGNICRDIKMSPLHAEERLFQDGETSVDAIFETIGGGGANSALFAAGLGAEACFAGKVGADPLGKRLEQALLRQGVRPLLRHDPATPTGSSVVLSYTNGCRHFVSRQPNNETLTDADIDLTLLPERGHLLRADIWFSQSMLQGGNLRLFKAARERGLATSLDLNWDPCWEIASEESIQLRKEAVRNILPFVNLVHGNIRELNLFADSTDLDTTLRRITNWGAEAVVLHRGAQGAGYYCNGRLSIEPCAPVQRHINATGSGDLLSVCMMLLYDRTEVPLSERLRLANRIVAEYISGDRNFLPPL